MKFMRSLLHAVSSCSSIMSVEDKIISMFNFLLCVFEFAMWFEFHS